MSGTYSQLYVQIVFSVKFRKPLISEAIRNRVERYICAIISNQNCKPVQIYCNPDHCHILIGLCPSKSLSSLVQEIKYNSSKWINANNLVEGKFSWQSGYGAFTYSRNDLPKVVTYIQNQPAHHKKISFIEEYKSMLRDFVISFEEEYI